MTQELNLILISLSVIVAVVLALRFKQPIVFWLLLLGTIIGPFGIGLVTNDSTINTLADFGSILLLFVIGVKFSIVKLLKQGYKPLIITSLKLALTTLIFSIVMILFGYSRIEAIIFAIIISISSTAIIIKFLENMGWINSDEVTFIVNILILEDIIAVIILTFISGLNDLSVSKVLTQIILTGITIIVTYLSAIYLIVPFTKWILKYSSDDTLPFIALSLALGLSYGVTKFGLSASAGAFLAGSIINFLPNSSDFEFSISSFTLVFSSIFFLSIGMLVNLSSLFNANFMFIAIIITLLVIILKFVIVSSLSFFYGLDFRQSIFSGLIIIPVGEFSLLIARESSKIGLDLLPLTSTIILLTALSTSLLLKYEEQIQSTIYNILPNLFKEKMFALQKALKNA